MRVDARPAERQYGRSEDPKASPPKICMSRKRTFGDNAGAITQRMTICSEKERLPGSRKSVSEGNVTLHRGLDAKHACL